MLAGPGALYQSLDRAYVAANERWPGLDPVYARCNRCREAGVRTGVATQRGGLRTVASIPAARGRQEAEAPSVPAPGHWIKNPAWDLVWVLNALWMAPLIL